MDTGPSSLIPVTISWTGTEETSQTWYSLRPGPRAPRYNPGIETQRGVKRSPWGCPCVSTVSYHTPYSDPNPSSTTLRFPWTREDKKDGGFLHSPRPWGPMTDVEGKWFRLDSSGGRTSSPSRTGDYDVEREPVHTFDGKVRVEGVNCCRPGDILVDHSTKQ